MKEIMTTQTFLRDARTHEVIGGVFGWIWMLGTVIGIGWIVAAFLGHASWLAGVGVVLGAQFAKAVAREYNKAARKAIANGIAAGQIVVDAANQARAVDESSHGG
jgi:hypothetical protein